MPLSEPVRERISSLVQSHPVLLFMKGSRQSPQCGFSATTVQILDMLLADYTTVDVLAEPEIRDSIKIFSSWPTVPQLYVGGEFLGGCDIVRELYAAGELHEKLGLQPPRTIPPRIQVTAAAAQALAEAADQSQGELHLSIDARFQPSLFFAPRESHDLEAEAGGTALLVGPESAGRADGLTLDFVQGPDGAGFRIENPNAPKTIQFMTVQDLKACLDARQALHLFDVRTPEERAIARIEGARPVDPETVKAIESMEKDTLLVFHCHHGGRSQAAAEHFAQLGFTNVHNLVGGIDAWALEIDPSVPRY